MRIFPERGRRAARLIPTCLALALGIGWTWREIVHADESAARVKSATIGLDAVTLKPLIDLGKEVGKVGIYTAGDTPNSSKFVTGIAIIDPGKTPHAPHTHPEEEVMVIESGHGEIFCDGKTTKVGPGSVMFTTPNASHGILNTGDKPLTFYFIKWAPQASK